MSIDKLELQSPDLANKNFKKLAALFPNCITESAEGKAIDFDLLKQELSHAVIEGNRERYRLEWPGKREAIVTANLPTTNTLRPIREDSVDFDNTENLYIEGDNLEVLKILQESYFGKIKMIYIDPPYNTGNDFVYKDNFTGDKDEELFESGQIDEYNRRLIANPEASGRYHSDWLSMMYPRLKLARNLLTDDGVIFISIDDNEVHNLRKVCDEVFGENNFVAQVIVQTNPRGRTFDRFIAKTHEYVLVYSKNIDIDGLYEIPKDEEAIAGYSKEDEGGKYRLLELRNRNPVFNRSNRPLMYYPFYVDPEKLDVSLTMTDRHKIEIFPRNSQGEDGCWTWGVEKAKNEISLLVANYANTGKWSVFRKDYLQGTSLYTKSKALWLDKGLNHENGKEMMGELFGKTPFDFPKSVDYIKKCLLIGSSTNNNDVILDFFSGSATTAHAIMQLNVEDGGNRKYIMVQLPEQIENGEYKDICEIGKERIRRAANKIKEEKRAKAEKDGMFADFEDTQDYGFRVYRLDSSNMQDVYYRPQDYKQETLDMFADNIKPDRSPDDLLIQVMLDWGLPLSYKIEQAMINGKQVFKVAQDSLYAYFDKGVDEDFVKEIAKEKPLRVVFRDSGFADDTAKINVQQLLKQLSPETEMKVI
ncbi:MAG: site-specific DNA-methyltransferase [Tannerella sp.]|jgi:adenine-specific DNA-methyltransferase|nr:site-specific DNA-methyltransferase [Tannerella sp.]